jgi:hypothetical protein
MLRGYARAMANDDRISLADNDLHGAALAVGAGVGLFAVAVVVGSVMLVLVLFFGAVAGAVVAALASLLLDRMRSRRHRPQDFAPPSLTAGSSPADERREAGHASPQAA